jgi:hypothetical protein
MGRRGRLDRVNGPPLAVLAVGLAQQAAGELDPEFKWLPLNFGAAGSNRARGNTRTSAARLSGRGAVTRDLNQRAGSMGGFPWEIDCFASLVCWGGLRPDAPEPPRLAIRFRDPTAALSGSNSKPFNHDLPTEVSAVKDH